jgi:hypothetical protein
MRNVVSGIIVSFFRHILASREKISKQLFEGHNLSCIVANDRKRRKQVTIQEHPILSHLSLLE